MIYFILKALWLLFLSYVGFKLVKKTSEFMNGN